MLCRASRVPCTALGPEQIAAQACPAARAPWGLDQVGSAWVSCAAPSGTLKAPAAVRGAGGMSAGARRLGCTQRRRRCPRAARGPDGDVRGADVAARGEFDAVLGDRDQDGVADARQVPAAAPARAGLSTPHAVDARARLASRRAAARGCSGQAGQPYQAKGQGRRCRSRRCCRLPGLRLPRALPGSAALSSAARPRAEGAPALSRATRARHAAQPHAQHVAAKAQLSTLRSGAVVPPTVRQVVRRSCTARKAAPLRFAPASNSAAFGAAHRRGARTTWAPGGPPARTCRCAGTPARASARSPCTRCPGCPAARCQCPSASAQSR